MSTDPRQGLPSASKMDRVVNCAGSLKAESSLPDIIDTKDDEAERGSKIHRAFETENPLELNEEETEAYQAGVKFTNLLVDRWKEDRNIISQQEGPRELRLWYNHPETLEPLGSAQLDRHYLAPPNAIIIDLKSGWATHVPPATKAWQLRFQALCLFRDRDDIERIRVAFAKALSRVGANDFCDYEKTDLLFSEQSMLLHLWESTQEDAPRHPGHWCRYCKAMLSGTCPEAAAHSLLPSVIASRAVAVTDKDTAYAAVGQLASVDLVKVWESSTVIEHIIDAVKKRLKGMTAEDLAALGLELTQGRKLDPITDVAGCVSFLVDTLHWPAEKVWDALSISKTDLADIAQQEKNLSQKVAAQWVNTALAEYITPARADGSLRRVK